MCTPLSPQPSAGHGLVLQRARLSRFCGVITPSSFFCSSSVWYSLATVHSAGLPTQTRRVRRLHNMAVQKWNLLFLPSRSFKIHCWPVILCRPCCETVTKQTRPRKTPQKVLSTIHRPVFFYLKHQNLALTFPTSDGRSVGIVRSRTKSTEFVTFQKLDSAPVFR
jgi:hypothetical protein